MPEILNTDNPFNVDFPAGKFFVGREHQLTQLRELLGSLSRGIPSNLFVVGKGGEGKTSYLEKILEEARNLNILAFRCNIDIGQSAEQNIDTLMRALLREFQEKTEQEGFEDDWKSGKESTFRIARLNEIRSDDLALDFERIRKMLNDAKIKACVVCIDEGQRIHPITLSALKNALQSVKSGYMIVLSLLNDPDVPGVIGDVDNEKAGREILNELASRSGDPGASRFFQNTTPLGLFDTQKEAEECIKRRLENNIIQFTQPAIELIVSTMRRHPRKMIILAQRVYNMAKDSSQREVEEDMVLEAFKMEYRQLIREAKELSENWSGFTTEIFYELAKSNTGMTAIEIVKKIYQNLENSLLDSVSGSAQTELDKLCKTKFCEKLDGGVYFIREPEYSYTLKLILGK